MSISKLRESLHLRPPSHPFRILSLADLGSALAKRFKLKENPSDIDDSIALHQEAIELRPSHHPDRPNLLAILANSLCARYKQREHLPDSEALPDLEACISYHRESLSLHPASYTGKSKSLHNFALVIYQRFERSGDPADLHEAITFQRKALKVGPESDTDLMNCLLSLSTALFNLNYKTGKETDLEEGIELSKEVLRLAPSPHPRRLSSLLLLTPGLARQYEQGGNLTDLDEAIAYGREALDLSPVSHPHRYLDLSSVSRPHRYTALTNLGVTLLRRYYHKGVPSDLEESIVLLQEALKWHHPSHPARTTCISNLCTALSSQYQQTGNVAHLDEAIRLSKEAVAICPNSHPYRDRVLTVLYAVLSDRYVHYGHLPDLQEGIALQREQLSLRPKPNPSRPITLHNLAITLSMLFSETRNIHDIEEAIELSKEGLELIPVNHPLRSTSSSLGVCFVNLYEHTRDSEHLDNAIKAFREAVSCTTAPFLEQFEVSKVWLRVAIKTEHTSALDAIEHTIEQLPLLSSLDMSQRERQEVLVQTQGIASDACSWAIHAGYLDKAVEFLSAARAVFWNQALHLRTPLDELRFKAPLLAGRLSEISEDLERSSRRGSDPIQHNIGQNSELVRDLEKEAARCRSLNDERVGILDQVRRIRGFEDFMRPKSFQKLQSAAANGPIAILNVSDAGCDGLLLIRGAVKHVPFPYIDKELIHILGDTLREVVIGDGRTPALTPQVSVLFDSLREINSRKGARVPDHAGSPDDIFRGILAVLWYLVALPVVEALDLKVSESPPRLWWCPVGAFSLLPIHAAGVYTEEMSDCLSDYVISSYAPTLDALLDPLQASTDDNFKMLTVIESDAPGQFPLLSALEELAVIQKHVPSRWLEHAAKKTEVDSIALSLTDSSFAHFACHGLQDDANPLNSALFLSGGHLTISKIMERPLPKASLAFLNACETAKGDEIVPDEAIHLSASLLFSGFRGVVGTLWPIYDQDAPLIVDVFYGQLFRKGGDAPPDPREAAYALHQAVKKLRVEKKVNFKRWIPFIHLGI